jgi:Ca-activated chloride channel family protein
MFRLPVSALLLSAALFAQDSATIRVDVRLVQVIATVKNRAGQLVGNLQPEDFEIYDNGVRQEIGIFAKHTEQPVSVALMLDTSGSTGKELKFETDSAARFVRAVLADGNPKDAMALFSFSYDINLLHDFSHNFTSLENQLRRPFNGSGSTSVYDAIYYAAQNLESREGRKVIVLVTDGGDTSSSHDVHQALRAAQFADAVVYSVVVLPITNDAGRNTGGEHALQFLADGTGGRTFFQTATPQLDKVFNEILAELRTQYVLGFYPRNVPLTRNPFHKLEVRVKSPDLQPSSRNGYYGDSEGGSSADSRTTVTPDRKKKNR